LPPSRKRKAERSGIPNHDSQRKPGHVSDLTIVKSANRRAAIAGRPYAGECPVHRLGRLSSLLTVPILMA